MNMMELPIVNNKIISKALTYKSFSSPLIYKSVELPVDMKPTEMLIKVKAASFNPIDILLKNFCPQHFGNEDKGIGNEFAGVVVNSGQSAKFNKGDNIYGASLLPFTPVGTFSEYYILDTKKALVFNKIPKGMSFSEAAALPIATGTAFTCLDQYHGNLKGKNVLVLGAGTSIGMNTIQFAKKFYKTDKIVATCSENSASKVQSLGADLTVDYKKGETFKVNSVKKFVEAHGLFDVVIDCVRDNSLFDVTDDVIKTQSEGGIFVRVARPRIINDGESRFSHWQPALRLFKYKWGARFGYHAKFSEVLFEKNNSFGDHVEVLWNENNFKPVIDRECNAFTEFQQAFDAVASGNTGGRVVCTF